LISGRIDFTERNGRIYALREKGATLKEIADMFHLSRERVRRIHLETKDRKENYDSWPPLKKMLSPRVQNALESYFVNEEILKNPWKIAAAGRYKIAAIKNIGKISLREIALALYELGTIDVHNEWLKPYRRNGTFLKLKAARGSSNERPNS
jgi:hypothetical protein